MKNPIINSTYISIFILYSFTFVTDESIAADNLMDALTGGHTQLTMRYRYERVESDLFAQDAKASTLRTRLNYSTVAYKGVTFFVEVDDVTEVFSDDFNSGAGTSPDRTQFPVVADPNGTEFNQAWVNYNISDNNFKLGRQRITLDNQRFIGGVAWRQNEQTYDAASFDFDLAGSKLFISYVDQVNRIFGNDVPAGKHDNNTLLINWSQSWGGQHDLTLFYYDIDNEDVSAFSTQTFGVSFDSFLQLENSLLSIGLDFARQSDGANNPVSYSANYWRIEAALEMPVVDFIVGREVLSGSANSAGSAFRTPLATLHAFNGWSDQFLSTPDAGLQDTYMGVIGGFEDFSWYLRYHDFEAQSTNQGFGYEVDASISYRLTDKISTRLKYAQYHASGFGADTQHVWFLFNYEF
ncbi:alginate export family protein [Marinicella sp. S1101]|uniref:alginate export family protein n=1 Tax=Marinicella marina TaxID=2996016 RepID=UPI002261012D|nr:alginate export family protein [Marinicella marina]MCX7554868.1 alginate export family protein [Marinicella marina]MDJ1141526.1 alginate export family protein [Marinicella marina]